VTTELTGDKGEIARWLVERIAAEIEVDPGTIDTSASFATFGIGSSTAVALASDIARLLSVELSATLLWDYPTIEKLSEHLETLVSAPLTSGQQIA
jgi:acyl carrier protein